MKTILVVDDDAGIVKLLESRLKANGFNVLSATEASDGLELAMGASPDLIILDVMMPIINGYNFCRLLKSQEKQKSIPVIFLTSRDAEDDIKIGKDMGAEAYLTKPVNMDSLLKTIQEYIKK